MFTQICTKYDRIYCVIEFIERNVIVFGDFYKSCKASMFLSVIYSE